MFNLSIKSKGVLTIFGSCLIYLVLGFNYVWGSINMYAASFYKFTYEPDLNIDDTSIVFAFSKFLTPFGIALALKIRPFFKLRLYIIFSGSLIFLSIFLAVQMKIFWLFALFFSILFGFFVGFLYIILMLNAFEYFPNNKPLVSGILMAFYGSGGLVFSLLAIAIINPDNIEPFKYDDGNEYFPHEIYNRFPETIRILAIVCGGLVLTGFISIFSKKIKVNEKDKDSKTRNTDSNIQRIYIKKIKKIILL